MKAKDIFSYNFITTPIAKSIITSGSASIVNRAMKLFEGENNPKYKPAEITVTARSNALNEIFQTKVSNLSGYPKDGLDSDISKKDCRDVIISMYSSVNQGSPVTQRNFKLCCHCSALIVMKLVRVKMLLTGFVIS